MAKTGSFEIPVMREKSSVSISGQHERNVGRVVVLTI